MKKIAFILLSLALCNLQLSAQRRPKLTDAERRVATYQSATAQLVDSFAARLDSVRQAVELQQLEHPVEALSPYLHRVTGPGVYYRSAVASQFRLDWQPASAPVRQVSTSGMTYRDGLSDAINGLLVGSYLQRPASVRYYDRQIEQEQIVQPAQIAEASTKDLDDILSRVDGKTDVASVVGPMDIGLKIEKPNFWKTSGQFGLQFTQNYFSQNWYKGGNNNVTLLTSLLLQANYNDQRKIQWDNKLEMRLGFVTVPSDTVHKFLTNNDKIYLYSKLGVKAFESFYYTVQGEAQTQFMPGYKSNDTTAYSRFLAPLDVYLSVGMDYKPKLKSGSLSLALLPFSYKMRYISGGDDIIIKAYKIRDGRRTQNDFGSKLEFNANIRLLKDFAWKSRFYYYTTYKYVEAELENVFSFSFNKYITAELYTLWRFDDNRDMKYWDESLGFFQFKEYFTLGLSYKF